MSAVESCRFGPTLTQTQTIYEKHSFPVSEEFGVTGRMSNGILQHVVDDVTVGDQLWPSEFVCPISNSVMSDPVIVASGQTYERRCIEAWFSLGQRTCVKHGDVLEHLFLIPNFAVKSSIQNFARSRRLAVPQPPDPELSLVLAKRILTQENEDNDTRGADGNNEISFRSSSGSLPVKALQELHIKEEHIYPNGNDEIQTISTSKYSHSASGQTLKETDSSEQGRGKFLPLPLATRPLSCSAEAQEEHLEEERRVSKLDSGLIENLVKKLQQVHAMEVEQAARDLLQLTREGAKSRKALCQPELLSAILPLLRSRYAGIQVISVAAMVNLSLEKENKVKIVRSGAVPLLIDVLQSGHPEAQGHAAGAIFSLALDDANKIAIGVLGAIPPLIHLLRTGSPGARRDAAMALYHLSHAQINRAKLVKVGAVPILLNLAQEERGDLACRVLLILCNIAAIPDGRTAILELNAINTLTKLLCPISNDQSPSSRSVEEIREHAAAVLLFLSQSILRFKSLVMEAGALDAIVSLSEHGTPRAKEKAIALLAIMRENNSGDSESSTSIFARTSVRRNLGRPQQTGLNSSEF